MRHICGTKGSEEMGDYYETSYVKPAKDGRRPRLCVTYHDADGRRRERTRTGTSRRIAALRREAEEWRAELNLEHEEEERLIAEEEERRRCPTVAECVGDWLAERRLDVGLPRAEGGIEPSTYHGYRSNAKNVTQPDLGIAGIPVMELDANAIREWERNLVTVKGLGPRTVRYARFILRQTIGMMMDRGVLDRDPMTRVKRRKEVKRVNNALDRASVAKLRRWLRDERPTPFRTVVALSLLAGMRRGECCGLRWRDVNLKDGVMRVEHAIGQGEGGMYLKCPKNGSARDVPISDELRDFLAERRDAVAEELVRFHGPEEAPLIFPDLFVCGRMDGRWYSPCTVSTLWAELRAKLGLRGMQRERCPFHDLRHTFITYQLYAGVPVLDLMPIVGHSNISMTLDGYAAHDPSHVAAMGARLDSAFPDFDGAEPTYALPETQPWSG